MKLIFIIAFTFFTFFQVGANTLADRVLNSEIGDYRKYITTNGGSRGGGDTVRILKSIGLYDIHWGGYHTYFKDRPYKAKPLEYYKEEFYEAARRGLSKFMKYDFGKTCTPK